jgi:hypothetical protein
MTMTSEQRSRSPLDYVAVVAAATAAAAVLSGLLTALAIADIQHVDGTVRFRLLADAASASLAAFALAAVAIVVHGRRRTGGWSSTQVAAGVALGIGAAVALVAGLLALNGVVVDLTQEGATALFRLGKVISRLATLAVCGLTLWLAATAPAAPRTATASAAAPPGTPPAADPPPSPPGAPDPSSPA